MQSATSEPFKPKKRDAFADAALAGFFCGLGFLLAALITSREFRAGWWIFFAPVMLGGVTAIAAVPNWPLFKMVRAATQTESGYARGRWILTGMNFITGFIIGMLQE